MAETFQLNGVVGSPTVTTTPALVDIANGNTGIIITNPDATNSIFVHPVPAGAAAPSAAVNLRGLRIYPGTFQDLAIANESVAGGCDLYLCTNAGSIQCNIYGVI